MQKPILDIIITHYDEPVEAGLKPFNMLCQQRLVNGPEVHVIIVQDGAEFAPDWNVLLQEFPFTFEVVTIPHGGVSAARNAGIAKSTADFMMFCDFDDMFSDVWSLCMILKVLPAEGYDILWMPYTEEHKIHDNYFHISTQKDNSDALTGKIFRSEFIKSKNIFFDTRLQFYEGTLFYYSAIEETSVKRYGKIDTDIVYPYIKTYRQDSRTHTGNYDFYIRRLSDLSARGQYLIEFMESRGKKINPMIANAVIENYFIFNRAHVPDQLIPARYTFADFYRKHKDEFLSVSDHDFEYAYDIIERAMYSADFYTYETYGVEPSPVNKDVSIWQWLSQIENEHYVQAEDVGAGYLPTQAEPVTPKAHDPRVAVYTGTRNVYENMYVSAKSLIANSNVDRVYFLIEDDTFPYDLPDIIRTMNVSGQQYFPKSSPNYASSWSYMCLMRAAFTKLFPDIDRVLSLDIDTIVQDDISALWDIDMSDAYIAGVQETDDKKHGIYAEPGHTYLNFGVIMMNLAKLRADGKDDEIISTINHTRYGFPEQDPFNLLCDGHVVTIDPAYNNTVYYHITDDSDNPKILHYAGIQYYKHFAPYQKYRNMSPLLVMEHHDALARKESERNHVVVYCGTRNTYRMMNASIQSLLAHTRVDKLYLLIEDVTFPYPLPPCATVFSTANQKIFDQNGPNYNGKFTYMPMLRAAFPILFPDDIVLSLDNDIIVERNLDPIFDYDLSDHYFAAVQETHSNIHSPDENYFNTGVMLMNLLKMRDDGIDLKAIRELNTAYHLNDSQDVLNDICKDKILSLPSDYNACTFTDPSENIIVRHFAGLFGKNDFWKYAKQYESKGDDIP